MSWDRLEYIETSTCACGKGQVISHSYRDDDDWNRTIYGRSIEIDCSECKGKYHIESFKRQNMCPSWVGNGISKRLYLVPNGFSIPPVISAKSFSFSKIDEEIVSKIPKDKIITALDDMITSRYTTRLQSEYSRQIVMIFQKKLKKRNLNLIINVLNEILDNYDAYEYTYERIAQFRANERHVIEINEKKIEEILKISYEIRFERE